MPREKQREKKEGPKLCPFDGSELLPDGYCSKGGGYPMTSPCPFLCPRCRTPLTWEGCCTGCWGQRYRGDPRRMMGDRYQLEGQHWRKAGEAEMETPLAIARACFQLVKAILYRETEREMAEVLMGALLDGRESPEDIMAALEGRALAERMF